jgi:prepilin peptidase CpaA
MHSVSWWPTLFVLIIATVTDLRSHRIPNWLSLPFLAAGIVVASSLHGFRGLSQSVCGIALAVVSIGVFCWLGGMGMGDVKLAAAIGAWIGPTQFFTAYVFMGLAGGVIVLLWAAAGGFLGELLKSTGDIAAGIGKRGLRPHPILVLDNPSVRRMPYAPVIAIGTILSFLALGA